MPRLPRCVFVALAIFALAASARADEGRTAALPADEAVNALLAPIRAKYELPGLAGAIVVRGKVVSIGAVGVRKTGSPELLSAGDQMHLGSCTKAMTATRLAMLIEQGKLRWDTTIGESFPDQKDAIHPDFHAVTLLELLTHRGGVPANGPWWKLGEGSTTEQRQVLLERVLKDPPESKPGTEFLYSNAGYAIAGLMAERATGKSWEELMRMGLFAPLGMSSAGFGPPGAIGKIEQPWGHNLDDGKLVPRQFDNAPALGPAGTVHASLGDWGKFIALHLTTPVEVNPLLKPATLEMLHEPHGKQRYACGWNVVDRPWAKGPALTHNGTNTYWFAVAWLAPQRDFAVLVATNSGGKQAAHACDDAAWALIQQAKPPKE
jgi:CubicO group peptidase (beta-lactamase class C family)